MTEEVYTGTAPEANEDGTERNDDTAPVTPEAPDAPEDEDGDGGVAAEEEGRTAQHRV